MLLRDVDSLASSTFFQFSLGSGGVSKEVWRGRSIVVRRAAWSDKWECSMDTSVIHEVASS